MLTREELAEYQKKLDHIFDLYGGRKAVMGKSTLTPTALGNDAVQRLLDHIREQEAVIMQVFHTSGEEEG